MGLQRVGHDWAAEQQQQWKVKTCWVWVTYKLYCSGRGIRHHASVLFLQSWGFKQDFLLSTIQSSLCLISRFILSLGKEERETGLCLLVQTGSHCSTFDNTELFFFFWRRSTVSEELEKGILRGAN